ncbi:hypothetical protein GHK03_31915 [Sinorhizobium medicae]|uniref:hypothetical protein n=1 Tax=Sinorhizobium medicae TaxID=110321 RepID=UPI0012981F4A|nr:hypothetical protein [Sinorhizobium medicae]MQY00627.1 hypothetical protein [Sinorhizobium medicae]
MKSPAFNRDYEGREPDCLDAIREPVLAVLGSLGRGGGWSQEEPPMLSATSRTSF